ncbi:MAG: DEAD/DEAH box helicase [Candidatus Woesearchaeota archaeon]|jgi:ATP-dependent RNA helicase DeaD
MENERKNKLNKNIDNDNNMKINDIDDDMYDDLDNNIADNVDNNIDNMAINFENNSNNIKVSQENNLDEFRKLGISENILKSLNLMGFKTPTDVQAQAIPFALAGKDVIVGSATGSGKTLAFGVNIIQNAKRGQGIKALILTPTRELAEQITVAFKNFSKYSPIAVTAIYGGVSINPQFKDLEKADVVVGTPGRILDHLERGTIDLSNVDFLVLDEADRMLDMGFLDDVRIIMAQCKKEKQTSLYSATISSEIIDLAKKFMKSPVKIDAGTQVDPKKLSQVYYDIQTNMKFSLLVYLMKKENTGLVMVFCNSRKYTDIVAKNLNKQGIGSMAIHGGLSQAQRNDTIERFNSKETFVLVCTDVAARGLDIPGVSHVYNFDMPLDAKQYVHRIGRTARAGKSGQVINLVCDRDHESFGKILREYDLDVKKMDRPQVNKIEMVGMTQPRGGYTTGGYRFGSERNSYSNESSRREDGRDRSESSGRPSSYEPRHRNK